VVEGGVGVRDREGGGGGGRGVEVVEREGGQCEVGARSGEEE